MNGRVIVLCVGLAVCCGVVATPAPSHGFSLYTDTALQEAAASWQDLDPAGRRELLTEMRRRRLGRLTIRTEHRFGYRVRAEGRRVTVQGSRTLKVDTDGTPFGAGFERRKSADAGEIEPLEEEFRPVREGPPP